MSANGGTGNGAKARNDGLGRPMVKRFYTTAGVVERDRRWQVQLDGRVARTPGKRDLVLPTEALGLAIAAEWQLQVGHVDPALMPLTRLANTAIDGVAGREAEVAADIVTYSGSDLLCYRADRPEGLVLRQQQAWDPVLAWAEARLKTTYVRQTGLMPVAQSSQSAAAMADALAGLDAFRLTSLHVLTTLMGSALLALAVHTGFLTADAAWSAAHIDEDWQIAEWGEDAEAVERRRKRSIEMQAAARMATLLGSTTG
ncbi:MAG: ATP12 family chaperone protein [Hyphomicrobiaceae bacterium]